MARNRDHRNGRLEQAIQDLVSNQASLERNLQQLEEGQRRLQEGLAAMQQSQLIMQHSEATLIQTQTTFLARLGESDARMTRIETILGSLVEMIERLPDAVREKIGFKA